MGVRDWTIHLPAGVAPAAIDLAPAPNLTSRWAEQWIAGGDAPALRDVDGRWLSAQELEARTRAAAQRLCGAGLAPGDRVLMIASSSAEFVIAYIASLRCGLTVVPLNPAYTRAETERVVRAAAPAAAVVDSDEHASWIRGAGAPGLLLLGIALDLPEGPDCDLDFALPTDTALLVYTSGTTGQPKGVPLTHANLLASACAVNTAWRWQADDELLLTLPLFHIHGLGVGLHGSLCAGAATVLRPGFDTADVAAGCRAGATLFFGVPAMYHRLARSGDLSALRGLRLIVSGSAPLAAELSHEIEAGAGQIPLERYGMTETVMLAGNPYEGERRPGTVGFPFPGVELRLAEDGEIQVRGPNVIAGYAGTPDGGVEAFTADRWFRTGDLGRFDPDGYLELVGRSKELIISGGYNVYPREVEEALATHPAVREVAVVGRPSERWGEEVTAVVVASAAVTPEDLRHHASGLLAAYKVPKQIEFTSELPRNALGKLVRGAL